MKHGGHVSLRPIRSFERRNLPVRNRPIPGRSILLNERPLTGSGAAGLNVRNWVVPAAAGGDQSTSFSD